MLIILGEIIKKKQFLQLGIRRAIFKGIVLSLWIQLFKKLILQSYTEAVSNFAEMMIVSKRHRLGMRILSSLRQFIILNHIYQYNKSGLEFMIEEQLTIQNGIYQIKVLVSDKSQTIFINAFAKGQKRILCYEGVFKFGDFSHHIQALFESWSVLSQTFKQLLRQANQNSKDLFSFTCQGQFVLNLQITILHHKMKKPIKLQLKKTINNQEEIRYLKEKVCAYQQKFSYLIAEIQKLKASSKSQTVSKNKLTKKIQQQQTEVETDLSKPEKDDQASKQQPYIIGVKDIDENCPFKDKFLYEGNKIISNFADYYQLTSKNQLLNGKIYKTSVKMGSNNHCSIGVLTESIKNNQYSFQNEQSLCFYSYFQCSFFGIYNQKKYSICQWPFSSEQILDIIIDMINHKINFSIRNSQHKSSLSLKQLIKDNKSLLFFLETYDKENMIQFIG